MLPLRTAKRWLAGWWLTAIRQAARNRRQLDGGRTGLRIGLSHNVYPGEFDDFRRLVDRCREDFDVGTPADVDALLAGTFRSGVRDRLLLTFDDGNDNNYQVAVWLAEQKWPAVFFIVPPFLGRTTGHFVAYHAAQGVEAYPLGHNAAVQPARGMAPSQVRELAAMGHRIGAHNYAHRDLSRLQTQADLEYEIGRSLEEVSELTGAPCRDFAVGFGHWSHISPAAVEYLRARCPRVYLGCRARNVPGRSPRFLCRTQVAPSFPRAFARASLAGALDHREAPEVRAARTAVGPLPAER